jgi:hypothetical protein
MIREAAGVWIANWQGRFPSAVLYHSKSLQAYVPMLADDQMIMNRDFEGFSNGDNLMGKMDVVGRWLRIARGMIMHQNIPCLPESSGDVQNFENNYINSMSAVLHWPKCSIFIRHKCGYR